MTRALGGRRGADETRGAERRRARVPFERGTLREGALGMPAHGAVGLTKERTSCSLRAGRLSDRVAGVGAKVDAGDRAAFTIRKMARAEASTAIAVGGAERSTDVDVGRDAYADRTRCAIERRGTKLARLGHSQTGTIAGTLCIDGAPLHFSAAALR